MISARMLTELKMKATIIFVADVCFQCIDITCSALWPFLSPIRWFVIFLFPLQVNIRNIDGATPLCDASAKGNVPIVQLLLQHGALVNPPLTFSTPVHEAALHSKWSGSVCVAGGGGGGGEGGGNTQCTILFITVCSYGHVTTRTGYLKITHCLF